MGTIRRICAFEFFKLEMIDFPDGPPIGNPIDISIGFGNFEKNILIPDSETSRGQNFWMSRLDEKSIGDIGTFWFQTWKIIVLEST